ncbi:hypothetical protein RhiirB3_533214 [Rhizophagus irregularis]|nr:hypothetical protein RhiirB3_533214 [Rhizophagus irregularis]
MQEDQYITYDSKANLCLFNQYNNEFCEERLTVLDQQIIYGKLHGMYKKALNKALKNSSKSEELINLLQEFAEDEDDSQMDQIFEEDTSDKENEENVESSVPILQNPRKKRGKGRPVGTKRFKSSCEVSRTKTKMQRHCKQCGKVGHYQKNCKVLAIFRHCDKKQNPFYKYLIARGLKAVYWKTITTTAAQIWQNNGGDRRSCNRLLAQMRNYELRKSPYNQEFDSHLETPMSWWLTIKDKYDYLPACRNPCSST